MKLSFKKIEKGAPFLSVHSYKCIDSTNTVAKNLAEEGAGEGTAVVALQQTAGRGRLGRSFLSQKGGVYFSIVLKPNLNVNDVVFITVAAAVAAARAIEAVSGKQCFIKWVNDIYLNNKKVCGILTEGGFNPDGTLKYAVLGVGINLFEPKNGFPTNLPLAGSVFNKGCKIMLKNRKKEQIIAQFANDFFAIYNQLDKKEFIKEYSRRSFLTGKEITFEKQGKTYTATVIGIDDDARLVLSLDGKTEALSHGEIQIVGMEQLLV